MPWAAFSHSAWDSDMPGFRPQDASLWDALAAHASGKRCSPSCALRTWPRQVLPGSPWSWLLWGPGAEAQGHLRMVCLEHGWQHRHPYRLSLHCPDLCLFGHTAVAPCQALSEAHTLSIEGPFDGVSPTAGPCSGAHPGSGLRVCMSCHSAGTGNVLEVEEVVMVFLPYLAPHIPKPGRGREGCTPGLGPVPTQGPAVLVVLSRVPFYQRAVDVLDDYMEHVEAPHASNDFPMFFLLKRQWLPKSKMVPLGIDETIDKLKMMEGRNSSIRKAVRIAFDRAMNHLSRVHGEPTSDLSDID